jgi:glutathione S-transferase
MPAFERYHKLFDDIEIALDRSLWLVDEGFSLAEVGYAPYLARPRHLGFDVLFERHPRVAEWSERVAKMPSVVKGRRKKKGCPLQGAGLRLVASSKDASARDQSCPSA